MHPEALGGGSSDGARAVTSALRSSLLVLATVLGATLPAAATTHLQKTTASVAPIPYVVEVVFHGRGVRCRWAEGATFGYDHTRANYFCGNPPGYPRATYPLGLVVFGSLHHSPRSLWTVTLGVSFAPGRPITPQPGFVVRVIDVAPNTYPFLIGTVRAIADSAVKLNAPRCPFVNAAEWGTCLFRLWESGRRMVPLPA